MKTKTALDFTERVGATALQAFLAVILVQGISDTNALKTAGAAAGLAAAKFAQVKLAQYLGS